MVLALLGCVSQVHLASPTPASPSPGPALVLVFTDARQDPSGEPRDPNLVGTEKSPMRLHRDLVTTGAPVDQLLDTWMEGVLGEHGFSVVRELDPALPQVHVALEEFWVEAEEFKALNPATGERGLAWGLYELRISLRVEVWAARASRPSESYNADYSSSEIMDWEHKELDERLGPALDSLERRVDQVFEGDVFLGITGVGGTPPG